METGNSKETPRPGSRDRLDTLPADLAAECRRISREIREEREEIREAKVIAAKIRIDTDYYTSNDVLRIVASRLLDERETD
jgi:hypothetical protein